MQDDDARDNEAKGYRQPAQCTPARGENRLVARMARLCEALDKDAGFRVHVGVQMVRFGVGIVVPRYDASLLEWSTKPGAHASSEAALEELLGMVEQSVAEQSAQKEERARALRKALREEP